MEADAKDTSKENAGATAKGKKPRKFVTRPPREETGIRINLRIRNKSVADFLNCLGKTERTVLIEVALVEFMKNSQDNSLLQVFQRGREINFGSLQSEPVMAKAAPVFYQQPQPAKEIATQRPVTVPAPAVEEMADSGECPASWAE